MLLALWPQRRAPKEPGAHPGRVAGLLRGGAGMRGGDVCVWAPSSTAAVVIDRSKAFRGRRRYTSCTSCARTTWPDPLFPPFFNHRHATQRAPRSAARRETRSRRSLPSHRSFGLGDGGAAAPQPRQRRRRRARRAAVAIDRAREAAWPRRLVDAGARAAAAVVQVPRRRGAQADRFVSKCAGAPAARAASLRDCHLVTPQTFTSCRASLATRKACPAASARPKE